mmetsp:Transcript_102030/g.291972  ORF Transcript_102030/g.291972 Transcript_102030/m.291972 type:complete len:163 (-) Transcript_102030:190-678(-)
MQHSFCANTLICTQTAEATSIFACTVLYFNLYPINTGAPGLKPIEPTTLLSNFAVMLIGEALISDAFVSALSRSNILKGIKVDIPYAWKIRSNLAYACVFVIISLTPSLVVTFILSTLCLTSTGLGAFDDYVLTGCPVAMGPAVDEDGRANPAYLNMSAGAW